MPGRCEHGWRADSAPRAARVASLGCLLLTACFAEPGEGRTLGTDLGTFSVQASEEANDCGVGALGSKPRLSFDVELARSDTELFWDGSGGSVAPDLGFELAASVRYELRPVRGADPGCAIRRQDAITGSLLADDSGAVTAISAAMVFEFDAEPESACTPREIDDADLLILPCSMRYALDGRRTRAPRP